jgi:hypothetical protein
MNNAHQAAHAAQVAIAQAIRASGVLVEMSPGDFQRLLQRAEHPLVVYAEGGFFSTNYQYLMHYKGVAFFTKASEPLTLPNGVETILAQRIWIPGS